LSLKGRKLKGFNFYVATSEFGLARAVIYLEGTFLLVLKGRKLMGFDFDVAKSEFGLARAVI
jgi:hypothetical protein